MRIRFNTAEIMACAWREFRQSRAVGSKPELPFSYFLKRAWNGARSDAFWLRDGMTCGGHGLCLVMED